jgi:hypothetical protein
VKYGLPIQDKTLIQQMAAVRRNYPAFSADIRANALCLKGSLQPTPRSESYQVEIIYHFRERPDINIIKPVLVKNFKGDSIPHVYAGNKLCLYRPKYFEFRPLHLLSDTIIPWTSLWLYYYETWHVTGDWLGGGEHAANK